MHIRSLILASVALTALAGNAFAAGICQSQSIPVPPTIIDGGTAQQDVLGPVTRNVPVGTSAAGPAHNGTAYTVATFCPAAAAAGTCTGESLSEFVAGIVYGDVTTVEKVGEVTVDLPDTVIQNPPQPQYRIGVQVGPKWIGTNWTNGTCPA